MEARTICFHSDFAFFLGAGQPARRPYIQSAETSLLWPTLFIEEIPMRFKPFLLIFLLVGLNFILARPAQASPGAEALARLVLSENQAEAGRAISSLRSMGPEGLRALFEVYAAEIKLHTQDAAGPDNPEWARLSAALDGVSQQRDSYMSGLYWYTDMEQAERAARATGKPILSLRLLGNLNEEFSCANSRFFRTVLYGNREVSKALRDRFILHWKSVRPAPRVTIDFGDGRKLERTITGNSIHYVLDGDGQVVDALPGLYGPQAFLRALGHAEAAVKNLNGQSVQQRDAALLRYHRSRVNLTAADWSADVQKSGGKVPQDVLERVSARRQNPDAISIAPIAMTKMVVEINILKSITLDSTALEAATDTATWNKIAQLHAAEVRMDEQSIALVRRHTPLTPEGVSQEQLQRIVQNLERNMALDTVRNEYLLHTRIHAWLAAGTVNRDVETLNEKVYAELFMTPSSDPWLGLYSPDTYTALENGGLAH